MEPSDTVLGWAKLRIMEYCEMPFPFQCRPCKGHFREGCYFWGESLTSNVNYLPDDIYNLLEKEECSDFHNKEYENEVDAWKDLTKALMKYIIISRDKK